MRQIPDPLSSKFKTLLLKNKILQKDHLFYLKWLRYYLDFCSKYGFEEYNAQSLTPFLKKFVAIITDEGGILSHAFVVARELKIPCVIGTKIATKVLKDGDKVEVNADKGIVKKI